ncbi:uncharacterized protein FIBRA_02430 [Fibroporia radiculosa]|uniref:SET domain-containing protein n=1 Tax=Fibroporia radiculosa TaxID=599839 RepID=J4GMV7_9APHY|nr:uncharacterized protein FIBRA_02430 [Fibroporia radiculosa]CCM00400.1 predicted protein [Fibroporia radiculosa]
MSSEDVRDEIEPTPPLTTRKRRHSGSPSNDNYNSRAALTKRAKATSVLNRNEEGQDDTPDLVAPSLTSDNHIPRKQVAKKRLPTWKRVYRPTTSSSTSLKSVQHTQPSPSRDLGVFPRPQLRTLSQANQTASSVPGIPSIGIANTQSSTDHPTARNARRAAGLDNANVDILAVPSTHPFLTASRGRPQRTTMTTTSSAEQVSSIASSRVGIPSSQPSRPVVGHSTSSPIASTSEQMLKPLEHLQNKKRFLPSTSSSSEDMPNDISSLLRIWEEEHGSQPSRLAKLGKAAEGGKAGLSGVSPERVRKKIKLSKAVGPVFNNTSKPQGTARRKSQILNHSIKLLSSGESSKGSRSGKRRNPVDVITISDSDEESPPKRMAKPPALVLRYDADGSILIDDDDGVDENVIPSSADMFLPLPASQLVQSGSIVLGGRESRPDHTLQDEFESVPDDIQVTTDSTRRARSPVQHISTSLPRLPPVPSPPPTLKDHMQELDIDKEYSIPESSRVADCDIEHERQRCTPEMPELSGDTAQAKAEMVELISSIGSQLKIKSPDSLIPDPVVSRHPGDGDRITNHIDTLVSPLSQATELSKNSDQIVDDCAMGDRYVDTHDHTPDRDLIDESSSLCGATVPINHSPTSRFTRTPRRRATLYSGPTGFFEGLYKIPLQSVPSKSNVLSSSLLDSTIASSSSPGDAVGKVQFNHTFPPLTSQNYSNRNGSAVSPVAFFKASAKSEDDEANDPIEAVIDFPRPSSTVPMDIDHSSEEAPTYLAGNIVDREAAVASTSPPPQQDITGEQKDDTFVNAESIEMLGGISRSPIQVKQELQVERGSDTTGSIVSVFRSQTRTTDGGLADLLNSVYNDAKRNRTPTGVHELIDLTLERDVDRPVPGPSIASVPHASPSLITAHLSTREVVGPMQTPVKAHAITESASNLQKSAEKSPLPYVDFTRMPTSKKARRLPVLDATPVHSRTYKTTIDLNNMRNLKSGRQSISMDVFREDIAEKNILSTLVAENRSSLAGITFAEELLPPTTKSVVCLNTQKDQEIPKGPRVSSPIRQLQRQSPLTTERARVELPIDTQLSPDASTCPSQEEDEEQEIMSILKTDAELSDGQTYMVPEIKIGRQLRPRTPRDSTASACPQRSRRSTSSTSSSIGPASLVDEVDPILPEPRIVVNQDRSGNASWMGEVAAKAGFELVTWESHIAMAREIKDRYPMAQDIPHDLQDRINALTPAARRAGNLQVSIFEATIAENTADDEPTAPEILIINDVDDELTPPFEFHYSNKMWHGEGVPEPDTKNLQGCQCVGTCDPTSTACSCILRQREYWDQGGFMYNGRRKLRSHEYPILECNKFCGCGDSCINRVVQHGRKIAIEIRKTRDKGWGIFAGDKKIPKDSFIGIYAGEYLTEAEAEERGSIYNKFGRTYLFDLDFWHLRQGDTDWENKFSIDAYHAGNFTRYLNHSCDPNCDIVPCYINEANLDKPLLTIFSLRDIAAGEELCFSYFGTGDDEVDDQDEESRIYNDAVYVPCQCGAAQCRGNMWK